MNKNQVQLNHPVIELAKDLVSRPSVTPKDEGCQDVFCDRLAQIGFNNESMFFEDTLNLWSRRGNVAPVFCFAGHTDVVPSGPSEKWKYDPFTPTIDDGFLYGRGAADMKGSLSAMLCACERFVADYPNHKGSIAFLLTSDEEGPFVNGTTRVIDTLEERNEKIDYCIVGEPSSTSHCGDVIKNGRRGSLSADLHIIGIQGHVAYPHLANNPIHSLAVVLSELSQEVWDEGNEYFPATTMQISNVQAGTGATNVIPGSANALFNFRYSTELDASSIIARVERILCKHELEYTLDWTFNGKPFLTSESPFLASCIHAVEKIQGFTPELSTSGGTSDGRFIALTGAKVIELGPENESIHKINEKVSIENLLALEKIYYQILVDVLA